MKANLANREPQMLAYWESIELVKRIAEKSQGLPQFILHDGPPYANGEIHIGHAVNKVLKDIIVKSKLLSGFASPYVPGWDCHGLPIELMVEKKIGKAGVKVDARAFRQACREYAQKQVEKQREDFMRLGILGAWDAPYLTMDYRYEADIVRSLGRIVTAGHLHKGFKPVHWCTDCGSALAEAEVEYQEKVSAAIDVRFDCVDANEILRRCELGKKLRANTRVGVAIWTTTPWTLPANQAVALNPKLDYVICLCQSPHWDEQVLVLADALHKEALQRYECTEYAIIGRCLGQDLEHLQLKHPFYERVVPVILGDHVTTEAGTGAVHTAPGHGMDDYLVGKKYDLEIDNPVGSDGRFLEGTQFFAGLPVLKANGVVIEKLNQTGSLLCNQPLQHSYPHCWRHKSPIIFRATPQWFISMDQQGLRDQAMAQIDKVDWIPDWGKARIAGMIENRPDWCISRQRTWGAPIALFVHKQTGELHPDTAQLIEKIAEQIEQEGIDAWFERDSEYWLGAAASDYDKVTDTLDVWFDSGVTHQCVLQANPALAVPADLYLEGSDQHRGWFQSSLLTSVAMRGSAPYRAVLTHGFTVDAQGRKMSKSVGNVVAPQKVVKALGADILRLWVASADYRGEMSVSDEILRRMADAYRRIRNTARYLLSNLDGFDPEHNLVPTADLLSLDAWIVTRAADLQQEILAAYNEYEFHVIYQKVHRFCAVDLGSIYLDITKDRQYTMQADSLSRRSSQTAMYHIVQGMSLWLAPVLSFTAEEIWQNIPGAQASIFLQQWYALPDALAEQATFDREFWTLVMEIRETVSKELEKLRIAEKIGSSLDAQVFLYGPKAFTTKLRQLGDEWRFILITSYASIMKKSTPPPTATKFTLSNGVEIGIEVSACEYAKCERCWHRREEVGTHAAHATLCGRCIENVDGAGEKREFA